MNAEERAAALDAMFADLVVTLREAGFGRSFSDPPAAPEPPSITCPACGARSYHPTDRQEGYCARCNAFTSPPGGNPPSPVS